MRTVGVIKVGKDAHEKLAVHAICDTAVAGDRIAKVLEVHSTLET